ncbi:MAG: methyltransferase domain-containing protein [Candidatus Omnitrophica bacterium]|nr:methyltransferase domain-containing protein [Candidatus Omnitrophota bacterium]
MYGADNIKGMKLYRCPERIYDELRLAGIGLEQPLEVSDLCRFDQYHYFGVKAVDDAIELLGIGSGMKILDIGSGIGGPARYMAHKTACMVTCVEMQPDLHSIAASLTRRCGLSEQIRHVCADILDYDMPGHDFDVTAGWLSFLHIPDRQRLFQKCFTALSPGGRLYAEDFYRKSQFTREEEKILSEDIYCSYLPAADEYKRQLSEAGFHAVRVIDMTGPWRDFVRQRMEHFIASRTDNLKVYDEDTVKGLEDFYKKMSILFEGNNLAGARIIAEK